MKGKYRRRHKRFNTRFVALLSSVVLIIGLAAGATIAYLADTTDSVVNTFTPGKVDVVITETFNGTTKSDVKVTVATDSVTSYVRAMVIINWVDEEGNILPSMPTGEGYSQTVTMGTGWTQIGDYYYYNGTVAADDSTGNLIDSATYSVPTGATEHLQIEILAEGIQAQPASAAQEAWGVTYANGSWS